MARKSLKILSILFFSISILARGVTGVPNAQIEIASADFLHYSITSPSEVSDPHTVKPSQLTVGSNSHIQAGQLDKSQIKTYKKYVSPDRATVYIQTSHQIKEIVEKTPFQDLWIFSSLPIVIHSNAPPMKKVATSFIGHRIYKGALNVEGETESYSGWRVSLLNSRTPSQ
jgi:hypothetical protein